MKPAASFSALTGRHRAHFDLLDAFGEPGCAICAVLSRAVDRRIEAGLAGASQVTSLLVGACVAHCRRIVEELGSREKLVRQVVESLATARATVQSERRRRWWRRNRPSDPCKLCLEVERDEARLVRWFLLCLEDIKFAREFREASPICLHHERSLVATRDGSAKLFAELQGAKLAILRGRLLKHEAVRADRAALLAGLGYLRSTEAAVSAATEIAGSPEHDDEPQTCETPDVFELEKLRHEVARLTERLGDAESRAASLTYQVATLSRENRDWEMRASGIASIARSLKADLRAAREERKRDGG